MKTHCPHGYNKHECGTCITAEKSAANYADRQRNAAPAAEEAPGQPAMQGEPVGYLDEAGVPIMLPKPRAWMDRDKEYEQALRDAKEYFAGSLLYTSPQPTPELVQAARQALEALENERKRSDGWVSVGEHRAIIALQNALKGQA